ncbi:MAG: regulatory protein GemA [Desulfovibrio sp.]|uniref:regulatory protein GemA n=1 Tax=Desulfovibrio sp. 7SRBS1 TaxID=3378064 RepID=UPI003B3FAAC6
MSDKIKRLRQKVRAAQHRLGIADTDYRSILAERYDVESTKQLSIAQLADLMNHFIAVGRGDQPAAPRKRDWIEIPDSDPNVRQKRKILAMCQSLGWSFAYLNERIKKQFGVEHIKFLRDQSALQTLGKDMVNRMNKSGQDPYPY